MSFSATYPFQLPLLPPVIQFNSSAIQKAVLAARVELAELNGYAHAIPNPLLLMSPWVVREAVASSEIENINTTILRALQNQLLPEEKRSLPDKEVLRYRDALIWGYENLKSLPLSGRLIRGLHAQLMANEEGFRRTQNFIQNSLSGEVIYTPPPPNLIPELMGNLEQFIHNATPGLDPLVKVALVHYQFEAIHPFNDGNGRTGRMLMVLQLIHEGIIRLPILYISGYIFRNKPDYYRLLRAVSEDGKWEEFVLFILEGFYRQAKATKQTLFSVMEYREAFRVSFKQNLPSIYDADLVDDLFSQPIVTATKVAERLGLHRTTATRYLQQMREAGLLQLQQEGKYAYFINHKLLGILSGL